MQADDLKEVLKLVDKLEQRRNVLRLRSVWTEESPRLSRRSADELDLTRARKADRGRERWPGSTRCSWHEPRPGCCAVRTPLFSRLASPTTGSLLSDIVKVISPGRRARPPNPPCFSILPRRRNCCFFPLTGNCHSQGSSRWRDEGTAVEAREENMRTKLLAVVAVLAVMGVWVDRADACGRRCGGCGCCLSGRPSCVSYKPAPLRATLTPGAATAAPSSMAGWAAPPTGAAAGTAAGTATVGAMAMAAMGGGVFIGGRGFGRGAGFGLFRRGGGGGGGRRR